MFSLAAFRRHTPAVGSWVAAETDFIRIIQVHFGSCCTVDLVDLDPLIRLEVLSCVVVYEVAEIGLLDSRGGRMATEFKVLTLPCEGKLALNSGQKKEQSYTYCFSLLFSCFEYTCTLENGFGPNLSV